MNRRAAYSVFPYRRNLFFATRCGPSSRVVPGKPGFSLTELLVAIAIIGVLMSLSAVAVNATRNSQKVNQTQLTITKLNRIISEQLRRYDSRYITNAWLTAAPAGTAHQQRAWYIRRNLINGDMPDRWADVGVIQSNPLSSAQKNYIKLWNSLGGIAPDPANPDRDSAECLFMIIMLGGFADCLDCGPMQSFEIGDTDGPDVNGDGKPDGDGLPEFLDAWGNPIGFLLWAPALELPPGTAFFGTLQDGRLQNPWSGEPTPMLGMRPLIYSGGPDGVAGYNRGTQALSSLSLPNSAGGRCGDPSLFPEIADRGKQMGSMDHRRDNITNFDAEARQ
jgi:prepilin-type N-terminal cleavage/methylation domain-containing protein